MADSISETNRPLGVLVVEDDREIRDMVTMMVKSMGYTVITAMNGKDAFTQLRGQSVDIVLLDLMMPEMDGFEFLVQMRAHPEWREIPVVVVSALELTPADRQRLNGNVETIIQKNAHNSDALLREVSETLAARIRQRASRSGQAAS